MSNRRESIATIGAVVAWPLTARAQQLANLPTVGFLGAGSPATADVWLSAFMSRLRELGWIEGRNINIDVRRQRWDIYAAGLPAASGLAASARVTARGQSRLRHGKVIFATSTYIPLASAISGF